MIPALIDVTLNKEDEIYATQKNYRILQHTESYRVFLTGKQALHINTTGELEKTE